MITSCIIAYAISSGPQNTPSAPLQIRGTSGGDIVIASLSSLHRFSGHHGAVLSLLHPFSFTLDRSTFRPSLFLSGGADFAVRLWDLEGILGGEAAAHHHQQVPLAVFYNHAAPIIALTVGPVTRSSYLAACVAAVADDGTVSVVSPNDRYTLLRARTIAGGFEDTAARVHAISWRLPEAMLLLLSTDGCLTVWDVGSGQLER